MLPNWAWSSSRNTQDSRSPGSSFTHVRFNSMLLLVLVKGSSFGKFPRTETMSPKYRDLTDTAALKAGKHVSHEIFFDIRNIAVAFANPYSVRGQLSAKTMRYCHVHDRLVHRSCRPIR